ncbi:hypothetical protein H9P43_004284 [Blastocladiella emersonii ATCC 22665]|nr:hypothetical protein H9P43_004284 [Blastocladiella emersonii ATCC 22665]
MTPPPSPSTTLGFAAHGAATNEIDAPTLLNAFFARPDEAPREGQAFGIFAKAVIRESRPDGDASHATLDIDVTCPAPALFQCLHLDYILSDWAPPPAVSGLDGGPLSRSGSTGSTTAGQQQSQSCPPTPISGSAPPFLASAVATSGSSSTGFSSISEEDVDVSAPPEPCGDDPKPVPSPLRRSASPNGPVSSPTVRPPTPAPYQLHHAVNAAPTATTAAPVVGSGRPTSAGRRRAGSMSGSRSPKATPTLHVVPPGADARDLLPEIAVTVSITLLDDDEERKCVVHRAGEPSAFERSPDGTLRQSAKYRVRGKASRLRIRVTTPAGRIAMGSVFLTGFPLSSSPEPRQLINLVNVASAVHALDRDAASDALILAAVASARAHTLRQYEDLMLAALAAFVPSPGVPAGKQRAMFLVHMAVTVATHAAHSVATAGAGRAGAAAGYISQAVAAWTDGDDEAAGEPVPRDLGCVLAVHHAAVCEMLLAMLGSGIEYYQHAALDGLALVLDHAAGAPGLDLAEPLGCVVQFHEHLALHPAGDDAAAAAHRGLVARAESLLDHFYRVLLALDEATVAEVLHGCVVPLLMEATSAPVRLALYRTGYSLLAVYPDLADGLDPAFYERLLRDMLSGGDAML